MVLELRCFVNWRNLKSLSNVKGLGLCSKRAKSYYITTPIYYVNSVPHIGHLYTTALADAAQRWERLKRQTDLCKDPSNDVVFCTGTDEHGKKVHDAATAAGMELLQFCDKVSERFKDLFSICNIEYTDFIRTTESRHTMAVRAFWQRLENRDFIYKGSYEGWYCTQDESFIPELNTTLIDDKASNDEVRVSTESGHKVEWMKETNYIFRLSAVIDQVRDWVNSNPDCVYPSKFRNLLLTMLDETTGDISISRERSRVPWGIETPSDPNQTVYVWLDALVNYLTVAGFPNEESDYFKNTWPADIHLIGVDILKFHAIYWPAFLIAAGLELPKRIVVHSHWLMNSRKMSKSVGNVVDPFALSETVTGEGLRYFLLNQGVLEHNCDYSPKLLIQSVTSDLCNCLGNCLNRAAAPKINPEQVYPPFHKTAFPLHADGSNESYGKLQAGKEDYEIISKVRALPDIVETHMEEFHFYKASVEIMDCVREANGILQRRSIWRLDQSIIEQKQLHDTIVHCIYETLRVCGILLQVYVPDMADKILNRLNVPKAERTLECARRSFYTYDGDVAECPMTGKKLGTDSSILIRRVKQSEVEMIQKTKKRAQ